MAEQGTGLTDEVGGILEGLSGKLPEANFSLDCSEEVRSQYMAIVLIASSLSVFHCTASYLVFNFTATFIRCTLAWLSDTLVSSSAYIRAL